MAHQLADAGEQAFALAESGADLQWLETMSSLEESEAAVKGARRTNIPFAAKMTLDRAGRTMMGVTPATYTEFATSLGLDAFGANCVIGPAALLDSVHKFKHREKTSLSSRKAIVAFLFMLMGRFIIMVRLN